MDDQHAEQLRAEQLVLAGMDPADRVTALLTAVIDAESNTFSASASLLDVLTLAAKYLTRTNVSSSPLGWWMWPFGSSFGGIDADPDRPFP
jgi:hypothetical protein